MAATLALDANVSARLANCVERQIKHARLPKFTKKQQGFTMLIEL